MPSSTTLPHALPMQNWSYNVIVLLSGFAHFGPRYETGMVASALQLSGQMHSALRAPQCAALAGGRSKPRSSAAGAWHIVIEVHTAHSPEGATEDEGATRDSHNAYTHALRRVVSGFYQNQKSN
jgi:hypothetical protein